LQNHDTAIIIANSALKFARQKVLVKQEVESIVTLGNFYFNKDDKSGDPGDPNKGYLLTLQALSLARQSHLKVEEVDLLIYLSNRLGNKPDSVKLLMEQAMSLSLQYKLVEQQFSVLIRKGNFYAATKQDSAKSYFLQSLHLSLQYKLVEWQIISLNGIGIFYAATNRDSAKFYLLQGLALARQSHLPKFEGFLLQTMAKTYLDNHWGDSAKYLMQEALKVARVNHLADMEFTVLANLTNSDYYSFLKDSLITYCDRMLLLNRQLHRDSLDLM
jgi:hypothetical protein